MSAFESWWEDYEGPNGSWEGWLSEELAEVAWNAALEHAAGIADSLYRGPGMDGADTCEFDRHPGNEIRKEISDETQ